MDERMKALLREMGVEVEEEFFKHSFKIRLNYDNGKPIPKGHVVVQGFLIEREEHLTRRCLDQKFVSLDLEIIDGVVEVTNVAVTLVILKGHKFKFDYLTSDIALSIPVPKLRPIPNPTPWTDNWEKTTNWPRVPAKWVATITYPKTSTYTVAVPSTWWKSTGWIAKC